MMPQRSFLLAVATLLLGCASFPELDGRPVDDMRAADLAAPLPQEQPISLPDFGNAGLRQMIAEANVNALDLAAARGRAMLADLVLAQAVAMRAPQPTGSLSLSGTSAMAALSVSFEPDLSGRINSAIRTAQIEHQVAGVDLLIARRALVQQVVLGWIALGEAQLAADRAQTRLALVRPLVPMTAARLAAGEVTARALAEVQQSLSQAEQAAALAPSQIALAKARLQALGVATFPKQIALTQVRLPQVPSSVDIARVGLLPEVCMAFLQFRSASSARADALLASRPRLVLTGSMTQMASSLEGLITGSLAPLASTLLLQTALLDNGQARSRLDQARLAVAQAEVAWLQARGRAEIALLQAGIAFAGARAELAPARDGLAMAKAELSRARTREGAGETDRSDVIQAELAVIEAQAAADQAHARALSAALGWLDASEGGSTPCRAFG
jgi:outer membrane protein, multidrug efflux system